MSVLYADYLLIYSRDGLMLNYKIFVGEKI